MSEITSSDPERPSREHGNIGTIPAKIGSQRAQSCRRNWWYETLRQSLAEFLGDLTFVFIGSMAVGTGKTHSTAALIAAFAHGLTIAFLIISTGRISGGHFNPAVTLAFALVRAIHPWRAAFFAVAQLLGGFIGALLVKLVTSSALYDEFNGITTLPHPGETSIGEAIACEVILTYFLVQTVLCAFVDSDGGNTSGALAVGFAIVVDILAGIDISGASMNPARSFGPSAAFSFVSTWSNETRKKPYSEWAYHYVYWVGPIGGAVLASLVHRFILATDGKRWLLTNVPAASKRMSAENPT